MLKKDFGARGLVGSIGALAEETGNSGNLVICRRTNLPFPSISQVPGPPCNSWPTSIALQDAHCTANYLDAQLANITRVHHCRPKQPVKAQGHFQRALPRPFQIGL